MPMLEDALKANPVMLVGVGVLALALPVAFPSLRPQFAAVLKSGVSLFFEAEAGAEGDIIEKLAETTADHLIDIMAGGGSKEEKQRAADVEIDRYKELARHRARKHGWSDEDRKARYHRHLAKLHEVVGRRRSASAGDERAILDRVSDGILEDW